MKPNHTELEKFLTDNTRNPALVPPTMELLHPFLTFAEVGQYKFGQAKDLDLKRATEAVSLATGKPVDKIAKLSLTQPFLNLEEYKKVYTNRLRHDVMSSLRYDRRSILEWGLWDNLGHSLLAGLRETVGDGLWDEIGNSPFYNLEDNLGSMLWGSLWHGLSLYLVSVITDNVQAIDRLSPMIQLSGGGYITLGLKLKDWSTGIIVVA